MKEITKEISATGTPEVSSVHEGIQQPFSGHFWDQSDAMTKSRSTYVTILLQRTVLIVIAVFAIFSIYWGALFRLPARKLSGWIVDFDGGSIGQSVSQELDVLSVPGINWQIQSPLLFSGGPQDVVSALLEERCWVAVVIHPGVTQQLNASLVNGGLNFNPSALITAYGSEARNENAFRNILRPTTEAILQQITHDYAVRLVTERTQSNGTSTSQFIPPELVIRPVYYTFVNLRPFDVPVATAVTFVGLIYLLILSFFVVNSGVLARAVSGLENQLTTSSLIRVRIVTPILMYLVLSCVYALVTLAFKLPFNRKFGHSGFVVFWMLAWFGMMAAGLALESMMTLLTIKYIQIFLILWIIGNVSVCLWPIDALPLVYGYGHVAPFYQVSRGVRAIVFSTKNEVAQNFGILFAWAVVSCFTLPLIQWYRRREAINAWKLKNGGV